MPGDTKLTRPPYSADMLQGWQNVLLDLGQQFLRGEAQVDPKQYPKTCEFCDLPGLCRIAESDPANTGDERMKVTTRLTEPVQPVDESARARTLETSQSFLVQAPAGSGKTELLTRRLLKLLAEVDEPEQILAITFTLAATAEMRERVLKALQKARDYDRETSENSEIKLARGALENDARRGWNLLQQPERLNIRTIDAVCLAIAHETPLLSRLGGSLSPTDKPQPLYTLAARRTLARLGSEEPLSSALRRLAAVARNQPARLPETDRRDAGQARPVGPRAPSRARRRSIGRWYAPPSKRRCADTHEQAIQKAQSLFAGILASRGNWWKS